MADLVEVETEVTEEYEKESGYERKVDEVKAMIICSIIIVVCVLALLPDLLS